MIYEICLAHIQIGLFYPKGLIDNEELMVSNDINLPSISIDFSDVIKFLSVFLNDLGSYKTLSFKTFKFSNVISLANDYL